jgi:phage recombination protein Bet
MAAQFDIEPDNLVTVLRNTVIKPDSRGKQASSEEVAAFVIVANQYGLNPFTREIHAFTTSDKGLVPIVGIDGWCRIVNRDERFDGVEFEDEDTENGHPISKTCIMHVKGRDHPVKVKERFSECKRNSPPWQNMPHRMLRHKAFMQAARVAFGLAGIYDEDEGRDIAKREMLPYQSDTLVEGQTATERVKKKVTNRKKKAEPVAEPVEPKEDPAPSDSKPVTKSDGGNNKEKLDSVVSEYVKATNKSEEDARADLGTYSKKEFSLDLAELSEEDIRQLKFHVAVGNV